MSFVFTTRDVDETRSVGGRVFHRHRVTVLGEPAAFGMSVAATSLGPIGLAWLTHRTEVRLDSEHEGHYQVNVPLEGTMAARRGAEEVLAGPGRAVVHVPDRASSFRGWSQPRPMLGIKIPQRALESELARLLDRPLTRPPELALDLDVSRGAGAQWLGLVRTLATGAEQPGGLVDAPLMTAPLTRSVLVGLLLATRHEHSAELADPVPAAGPATVRAARAFLEQHAAEPITVAEVARAAGVGVRGLQLGFRRALGTTPTAHLRELRLHRAHAELRDADPAATTVAAVAARWGFGHPGRFAALHRERFGVGPADVLRGPR